MDALKIGLGAVILALFLALGIGSCALKQSTITTVTDTYQGFERINKGDSSYYLMYFNNEVYKNEDDWINGKFNSSDICRTLKKGTTYELVVKGWRVQFWSMYRNILDVRGVVVSPTPTPENETQSNNGGSMKLTP